MINKKYLLHRVCGIFLAATLAFGGVSSVSETRVKAAPNSQNEMTDADLEEEAKKKYEEIMGISKKSPSDWGENKDPYGYGVGVDFNLVLQNELFVYKTNGSASQDIKSYDNLRGNKNDDQVAENSKYYPLDLAEDGATKAYTDYSGLSYVQSVAFDPKGTGRKDHIAVIGVKKINNKEAQIIVNVMNKDGGWLSTPVVIGNANWITNQSTTLELNNDKLWDFNAMNFIDITAGDYNGDKKETLVVWACLDKNNYGLFELYDAGNTYNKKNSTANKNLLHNYYPKDYSDFIGDGDDDSVDNKLHCDIDTGDINGDGIDDLFVLSYVGRVESSGGLRKKKADFYRPLIAVRTGWEDKNGNGADITKGYSAICGVWQSNNSNNNEWTSVLAPGLAVGDIDGDGKDEAVVAGIKNTIKGKSGENVKDNGDSNGYNIDPEHLVIAVYDEGIGRGAATFDASQTTNKWTYTGAASTTGGLFLADDSEHDQSWQRTAVETVAFDGKKNAETIFINGYLYSYSNKKIISLYQSDYFKEIDSAMGSHSNEETYIRSMAVGMFDGNVEGREQIVFVEAAAAQGATGNVTYTIGMIGGVYENDGVPSDKAVSYYSTTQKTMENSSYYYPSSSSGSCRYGDALNFDICAWDNDCDGLHVQYIDKDYVYTDPEVKAIIQAAPYFEEMKDSMNGNSTAYTISTTYSAGKSDGKTTSLAAGIHANVEYKVVEVDLTLQYAHEWSSSFRSGITETDSQTFITYGDDQVIIYRTPITIYNYMIETINNKGEKKWDPQNTLSLSFPGAPEAFVMSIPQYNAFAEYYNIQVRNKVNEENIKRKQQGKETIKEEDIPQLGIINDQWLGHKGDPFGYMNKSSSGNATVLQKSPITFGVGDTSTGYSWSKDHEKEEESSESNGFALDLCVGFGYKGDDAGFRVGPQITVEHMQEEGSYTSEGFGEGISCEVGNMDPDLLEANGISTKNASQYGFKYQMVTWPSTLLRKEMVYPEKSGEKTTYVYKPVPIYGYMLDEVKAGLAPVSDLKAELQTDNEDKMSVKLTWSNPSTYNRVVGTYTIYQIQKDGRRVKLATVGSKVNEYVVDLDGRNDYSFVIRTNTGEDDPNESIDSNIASVYFEANALYKFELKEEGQDVDTYVITHTNGTKTEFFVKHGRGISSIAEDVDKSDDTMTVFTITYTDGTTFDMQIPRGPKGEKGDTGNDGKSAYDLAKDGGYTGTLQEWLNSLQANGLGIVGIEKSGSNGLIDTYRVVYSDGSGYYFTITNGANGKDGADGKDGIDGKDGVDGKDGTDGKDGKSAYEIAVDNGFVGTEVEWLESLKGQDGQNGKDGSVVTGSSIGVDGINGKDGQNGKDGANGLNGTNGINGLSAYEIALNHGFVGTEEQWLESLKVVIVEKGESAYEIAVRNGFTGTEAEWLESLKGKDGQNGSSYYSGSTMVVNGKDGVGIANVTLTANGDIVCTMTDGSEKVAGNILGSIDIDAYIKAKVDAAIAGADGSEYNNVDTIGDEDDAPDDDGVPSVDNVSISKITRPTSVAKAFTIKWTKVADADGYEVRYCLKNDFSKSKTVVVDAVNSKKSYQKLTVKGLKGARTYYVQIRAFVEEDGIKYYSDWSDTVSKKTLKKVAAKSTT